MKIKIVLISFLFLFWGNRNTAQTLHKKPTASQTSETTIDEQITFILKTSGQIKAIQEWLQKEYLNPVILYSDNNTSDALSKIIALTSDEKITKKLISVFKKNFTAGEIKDIYTFSFSPVGRKYFGEHRNLTDAYQRSFEPLIDNIKRLERISNTSKIVMKPTFSIDKPDGFYFVLNYDLAKYEIDKYKLEEVASINMRDIITSKTNVYPYELNKAVVEIELTPAAAIKFEKLTGENIGKPIAIVIDHVIVSTPIINSAIPGGKLNIAGDFSLEEAQRIAKKLTNQQEKR